MNIYKDINRARQIPYTEETVVFVRQPAPSTSRHNRKPPRPKPPRNLTIYDNKNDDDNDNDDDDDYSCQRRATMRQELYEHEIASSIREVNGGVDYSNESLEKHWRERQDATSMSSEEASSMFMKPTVEVSNEASVSETEATTENNENVLEEENILKQCKLNKNAAIRGLLRNRKISLTDLQMPSSFVYAEGAHTITVQKGNVFPTSNVTEEDYSIKLVQCPEEPEVFVRPLQACGGIDENKYKNIDFSVPHLGRKKIITPRQFYAEMDDSDFDFVKKDTKGKT
ncbi:uncharacterized protein LOC143369774 [Andrena cerasifolii]|uniref:uncharacterized protein LOC143369774 n=1 Tax=Andrena cerasifolii TaxID=2819439 RepID=UPI004037D4E8